MPREFNKKCDICGKHIIYVYEHTQRQHGGNNGNNGHKRKSTSIKKTKTKTTPPPQPPPQTQITNDKDIQPLIQEIEKLRREIEQLKKGKQYSNELSVARLLERIEDLEMVIHGKIREDQRKDNIIKFLGKGPSAELLDELNQVFMERAQQK